MRRPLALLTTLAAVQLLSATAAAAPVPELIITEIVPASASAGQPYEFVEIFNTTDQPIDLHNYKLLYFTSAPFTKPGNTWAITNKVVPAKTALVLWLKKYAYPNVPLVDFNANYGTSLTADQVFEVRLTTAAQGLHDSAIRRVAIGKPDSAVISAAYINDGAVDGISNKSVIYRFADVVDMEKIANGQLATPGVALPIQIPGKPVDTTPPAVPADVAVVAGAGQVSVSWSAVADADLAEYRVYVNGLVKATVGPGMTSTVVSKLAGGTYAIAVSAVDGAGNESAKSEAVAASPTHQIITQQERGAFTVDAKYPIFTDLSRLGAVVPGLVEDLIPQGLAFWPGKNWLVTSNYLKDGRPSVLTIVDVASGSLVKSLRMYQENGAAYVGHAGGLAVSRDNLWVASGGDVYAISLAALEAAPENGDVRFERSFPVETNASFVAFEGGILWVGEFYHPTAGYNTKPSHQLVTPAGATYGAWIAGYRFNDNDLPAFAEPDYVFSVRDQIQGMALTSDSIVLSRSYGRKNDSFLFRYARPDLNGAPHQVVSIGPRSVPLWILDEAAYVANEPVVVLPPLAEGIVANGDSLFVLLESGANEYRYDGFNPLERFGYVSLSSWTRYGSIRIAGTPDRMEIGESAPLSVLRFWGNRGEADVSASATLSVANPAIASVAADGTLAGLASGDTSVTAVVDGRQAVAQVHVVAVAGVRLAGPAERKVTVGVPVAITVEALYDDGSTKDVTAQASFLTEHGGKVTIANGTVTGEKPGDVRIVASYKGVGSNELRVTVSPAEAGKKK